MNQNADSDSNEEEEEGEEEEDKADDIEIDAQQDKICIEMSNIEKKRAAKRKKESYNA